MEQGNLKLLLLKLSGAALGLVVMLAVAFVFGPNKTLDGLYSSDEIPAPKYIADVDQARDFLSNEKNELLMQTKLMQKEALRVAEEIKNNQFEYFIEAQSSRIEAISDAIDDIMEEESVPSPIKENIIADLELQLKVTEKELSKIEDHVITFTNKIIFPQSKLSNRSKCDETIVVEKCDGDCTDDQEKTRNSKGSREAFYWI